MTQEEKARAYDEAIRKLRGMMPNWERLSYNGKTFLQDLIYIIPELAESEDERIIKAIKSAVLQLTDIYLQEKYGLKQSDCIAWLEKQKPIEWSEEDDSRYSSCLYMVERETSLYNWLKSLKERVLPQPKQEWSEEDEQHIDSLLKRLDGLCKDKFERTRFAISEDRDWLKSLRPQNLWKPSELQLGCLSDAIEYYNSSGYPAPKLKELYEQLKKL